MKDIVAQHPSLVHFQKEIKGEKVKAEADFTAPSDEYLYQLIPSKEVTDSLIELYIESFESTYRVLHLPSWSEEYHRFWESPAGARPEFVALLLVMIATTSCLKPRNPFVLRGDSSLDRETAIRWIHAAKTWVHKQSNKHVKLVNFQIHCIIFIAENINDIKRKRTWTASGTLSRLAMATGLHRDAEMVNLLHGNLEHRRVSLFDQEMRRRIWATIVELELQTSLERGMPATLRDAIVDCGPPLNVDDHDITPSMDKKAVSRPVSEYTRSSFLYYSHSILPLRQDLVSLINCSALAQSTPYEDVLEFDRRLTQAVDDVPEWETDDGHLARTLVQLQLQDLLLLLHRPFVQHDPDNTRCDYSAMAHFRAALNILDLHQTLVDGGSLMLCILRDDMIDAALGICYNLSISNPSGGESLRVSILVLAD